MAEPVFMKSGQPWLYSASGDIVGVKDPDGSEQYFATSKTQIPAGAEPVTAQASLTRRLEFSKSGKEAIATANSFFSTPALQKNLGTKIHDAATGSVTVTSGAVAHAASTIMPEGYCTQLGSAGNFDYNLGPAITETTKWIGFYAYKDMTEAPSVVHIYLTGNGFGRFSEAYLTIHPGVNFYQIPCPGVKPGTWNDVNGGFVPTSTVTMRVKDSGYASVLPYTGESVITGGRLVQIGNLYADMPSPKAKFLICFDDCLRDMIAPYAGAVGYDGIARPHTVPSMVASYGFRLNFYAIAGALDPLGANFSPSGTVSGGATYMTASQLKRCRDDYGVFVGAHTYSHPTGSIDIATSAASTGLRLLGSYGFGVQLAATGSGTTPWAASATGAVCTSANGYSAILADLEKGVEVLSKLGFQTAAQHLALPQGSFDTDVNTALECMGFRTVRGIEYFPAPSSGAYCFRGTLDYCPPSIAINLQSALPIDNVEATTRAYVDLVIASGGVGASYMHTFSNASAYNALKILCDVLKEKQLAGLLDVITLDELSL